MNDSLRTDVFVRYPPETIAAACIYLSARKLKVALPKNPGWFEVLSVEEDDIKDCCYRMICLYNKKKPNHDELEAEVENLRQKLEDSRRASKGLKSGSETNATATPNASTPPSRSTSPARQDSKNGHSNHHKRSNSKHFDYENGGNRSIMDSNYVKRAVGSDDNRHDSRSSKKKSRHRGRSRSSSRDRRGKKRSSSRKHRRSYSRSPESEYSPSSAKKSKKHKSDKSRHRGRSRERFSAGSVYSSSSSSKNGSRYERGGNDFVGGSRSGKKSSRDDYYRR